MNNNSFGNLNQLFSSSFLSSYKDLRKKKKLHILKYISQIYRRWLYSALIENTGLTPANIIMSMECQQNGKNKNPVMRSPAVLPVKSASEPFRFVMHEYSLDRHPAVKDLKIFIDSCMPDVELDNSDMLSAEHVASLSGKLSLSDAFYVEYLLNISIMLNIIKKTPSIYSNRAQVTSECKSLFKLSDKDLFTKIVDASIDSANSFINEIVPLPETHFSKDTLRSYLKSPKSMDDIFQYVYSLLGVRLQDICTLDDHSDPFDELNSAVITSTFLLGLVLDKYFLTPFGYYLQLIRPLYTLEYDFDNELNYLADSFDDEDGPITALYAPSTYYRLTPLGAAFFEVECLDPELTRLQTLDKYALESAVDAIAQKNSPTLTRLKNECKISIDDCPTVYAIKARLSNMKSLWKTLEVPGSANLHQLFSEICYQFSLDPSSEYSFFLDSSESPFNEYTSMKNPRKTKKTSAITLDNMELSEKRKFVLALFNSFNPFGDFNSENPVSKKIKLELEIVKIKARDSNQSYPRVSRMSAGFREFEE
ncbi:MAG: hypothetical protein LBU32_32900 [Clostridiales bacterium]|jgi:hypothetical protein|nr:hypothetical protein [Clostridiales bacterium]